MTSAKSEYLDKFKYCSKCKKTFDKDELYVVYLTGSGFWFRCHCEKCELVWRLTYGSPKSKCLWFRNGNRIRNEKIN